MTDAAPLIETADAKAPPGGEAAWYVGAGAAKLRAALWTPPLAPGARARGSITLSGGRTEPIEKYYEFIAECLERGFVVLVHDWRGQGLSRRDLTDPLKGHAKGFKPYLDDFRLLLNTYADRLPKPWVAVAHSMGGCLTLLAMAQGETRFAGAIFSAPMLGIKSPFPPVLSRTLTSLNMMAGRGSAYTLGGAGKPYQDAFEGNVLTHDPVRHARSWSLVAAEPKLALGAPTWGWVDFGLRATAFLGRPEALRNVTVPVVIVSAEDDQLVDTAAQAAVARHLPQGKFISVPGAYHEILMETDTMRNMFLRAFDALAGRVAPPPPAPPIAAPATAAAPSTAALKPAMAEPAAAKPAVAPKPANRKVAARKPAAPKPAGKGKPAVKKLAAMPATRAETAAKPAAAKKLKAPTTPAAMKAPAKRPAATPAAAKKPALAKTPAAKKLAPTKLAAPKLAAPKLAAPKPAAPKLVTAKAAAASKPAARKSTGKTPAVKVLARTQA